MFEGSKATPRKVVRGKDKERRRTRSNTQKRTRSRTRRGEGQGATPRNVFREKAKDSHKDMICRSEYDVFRRDIRPAGCLQEG